MVFIKLSGQEKYTWKHYKYGIQANGLAMAKSGWGWDWENPWTTPLELPCEKKQTMTFLTAPKTQYDWNREIRNLCHCAKDPQIINHTALLGSLFLVWRVLWILNASSFERNRTYRSIATSCILHVKINWVCAIRLIPFWTAIIQKDRCDGNLISWIRTLKY